MHNQIAGAYELGYKIGGYLAFPLLIGVGFGIYSIIKKLKRKSKDKGEITPSEK